MMTQDRPGSACRSHERTRIRRARWITRLTARPAAWPHVGVTLLLLLLLSTVSLHATVQQASLHTQDESSIPDAPQPQLPTPPPSAGPSTQTTLSLHATVLHGTVTSTDGTVYGGARITLTQTGSTPTPDRSATSDSDGHFHFDNLQPGNYQLTVSSDGFATKILSGTLRPGEDLTLPAIVLPFATTNSEVLVTVSNHEIAQEQLQAEEHQRVFGAIPNFYVVYAAHPQPLSPRQKYHLAWRSNIDPVTFLFTGAVAGIQQANNDFREYGQGSQGYAKRFGANYADGFIGNMLGGAVLPALFHQDPRYFYKGTGTKRTRALYAIANAVICKGDNGHWQFNYSGIGGSLAAAGISNLYYPASERNGITLTIQNTFIGIGSSAIGNIFQEFLVKKLTPRVAKSTPSAPNPTPSR